MFLLYCMKWIFFLLNFKNNISGVLFLLFFLLILFLRFDEENVYFIWCDENINCFIDCGLIIINGKYLKCLDKRFCNNFDILRYFLFDSEFYFFLCYSFLDVFLVEMINMFEFFV